MRTAKQQAAKALRDANRAHDMTMAQANADPPTWISISCEYDSHEWCMYTAQACKCECHRKAHPRNREAM